MTMARRSLLTTLKALALAACLRPGASFAPPSGNGGLSTRVADGRIGAIRSHSHDAAHPSSFTREREVGSRTNGRLFSQPASTASEEALGDWESAEEELTPSTIAEMIEVSFLNSCLQLGQGYIDVLKLFIVAVKAGYEEPLSLEELHTLVEDCPVNSAGRDLMVEEKALRLEWMRVVYGMLNALNPKEGVVVDAGSALDDDEAAMARIEGVIRSMLAVQSELENEQEASGGEKDAIVAMANLSVEQALERSSSLSQLNDSLASDPMAKAFFTNDVRVALVTFRALEEERVCMQDASGRATSGGGNGPGGDAVPRPPIPGT